MFLSDRDLLWAIRNRLLIVDEPSPGAPHVMGATSIDLHLDDVEQAKVWDIASLRAHNRTHGLGDVPAARHLGEAARQGDTAARHGRSQCHADGAGRRPLHRQLRQTLVARVNIR